MKTPSGYLDMLERMEAQILLEGETQFADFVKTLNANIERYKNTLARRKANNKDDNATSEQDLIF